MATEPNEMRQTGSTRGWSVEAVLAEREIDKRTIVVEVHADAGLGASLALSRRLLGLRIAGFSTMIVAIGDANRVTDPVVATVMRCRRKLGVREGRLVAAAGQVAGQRTLAVAGLEVADERDDW